MGPHSSTERAPGVAGGKGEQDELCEKGAQPSSGEGARKMQNRVGSHTQEGRLMLSIDPLSIQRRRSSPPPTKAKAGQQPQSAMIHAEHIEGDGGDLATSANKPSARQAFEDCPLIEIVHF
ncbi:unnamed protein product, partial [Scytosiphon promiscuus]